MNPTLIAAILSGAVPTLAIILGILLSRSDYHKLNDKIDAKIDRLETKLDAKIDTVRAQQHADMLRIYELFDEPAQRLTRLETQVQGR
jgi:hypothetical protein